MDEHIHDLVIVGGGPAGLSAGIYAKRAALDVVLVEKGMPGGQIALTQDVENYPGIGEIGGFELCEKRFWNKVKCVHFLNLCYLLIFDTFLNHFKIHKCLAKF